MVRGFFLTEYEGFYWPSASTGRVQVNLLNKCEDTYVNMCIVESKQDKKNQSTTF
jgi:hypothetical protein